MSTHSRVTTQTRTEHNIVKTNDTEALIEKRERESECVCDLFVVFLWCSNSSKIFSVPEISFAEFYVPSRLRFVICFVYSQTLDIGSFCASRSFEAEIDHERSFGFQRRTVRPAVSANFS